MEETTLVLSLTSILFTGIAMIFSFASYAKVIGIEKSTHQVQYVPLEGGLQGEELVTKMKDTLYPDDEDEFI